jgi:hypothetical protein
VPQVDADGSGLAGVKMPELTVPLATYTGWNLFNDRSGPTTVLSSMPGSSIRCREPAQSGAPGDPRQSIDERYHDKDQCIGLVTKAAQDLIDQGFLLAEDLPSCATRAGIGTTPSTATPSTPQR